MPLVWDFSPRSSQSVNKRVSAGTAEHLHSDWSVPEPIRTFKCFDHPYRVYQVEVEGVWLLCPHGIERKGTLGLV